MQTDYYAILELPPNSSDEDIKAAYRKLARQNHPDVNPNDRDAATERLRLINEAYEVLSDPEMRRNYSETARGRNVKARPHTRTAPIDDICPPLAATTPRARRRWDAPYFILLLVVFACVSLVLRRDATSIQQPAPTASDQILDNGIPRSDATANSDLTALSAEFQQVRPQIESIYSQGESEYARVSSQPDAVATPSTPAQAQRETEIDALKSDLQNLDWSYKAAQTELEQSPTSTADSRRMAIEIAREIYTAKDEARKVAGDVRGLETPTR